MILKRLSIAFAVCVSALAATTAFANLSSSSFDELPLVAMGPVSYDSGRITVNGQIIVRDKYTTVETENAEQSSRVRQGDYIAVVGDVIEPGKALATSILILDEEFVEGSSRAYLRAIIDSTSSDGIATSADTAIDITGTLHNTALTADISSGNTVEFFGTTIQGLFVASEGSAIRADGSITAGARGTGVRGARGTGVRGARGTGVRGARGTGVRGARGTGVRGARGTGVRGARGTGVRGARGTGVRGARGTGVRGARGTGVRGARGTGVRGARGTGVRGARGTGVRGARGTGVRGARGTGVRGARGTGVRGARGTGVRGARGTGVR